MFVRTMTALVIIIASLGFASTALSSAADGMNRNDDEMRLRARFRNAMFISVGNSQYREREKDGLIERRFKVQLRNVALGDYDITVAGYFAGTLTVGKDGSAEFQLRTPEFIDGPDDGLPMPADFPPLNPGDVVTVGSFTSSYAAD